MNLPAVAVVIANWNGQDLLGDCLGAFAELDYPSELVRVIVVDNASTDDSVTYVRANFPDVEVIENEVNNYAMANNLGVKASDSPYVAFLNTDTRVDAGWLKALVAALEETPDAAAVGSKVLFMDGRINSTGIAALPDFHWQDRGFGEKDAGQFDAREEVDGISGCSVLFRRDALVEVGLVDEDFEMYYEDVDLSYRLRAANYKLLYEPKSVVHHHYNASIKKSDSSEAKDRFGERNRLFVQARHFPLDLLRRFMHSRYFLECRARDLRRFLPLLVDKWESGDETPFAGDVLVDLIRGTKLEVLRSEQWVREHAREIRVHEADKERMLSRFQTREKNWAEEMRGACATYEEKIKEIEADFVTAKQKYEALVADAEAARDKARGDVDVELEQNKTWQAEIERMRDGYETQIKELDVAFAETRDGYETQIKELDAALAATRDGYEVQLAALVAEHEAARKNYESVIEETAGEREDARTAHSQAEAGAGAARAQCADREHWLRVILSDIAEHERRPLEDAERAFLESSEPTQPTEQVEEPDGKSDEPPDAGRNS